MTTNQITTKSTALCLCFFFVSTIAAQTTNEVNRTIDTLYSKVLKQNRILWIHTPAKIAGNGSSGLRYPVIYVLDGEASFYTVTSTIRKLRDSALNTSFPSMIVVGVGFINPGIIDVNAERTRDYTPTHVESSPFLDSSSAKSSGGGANFVSFLEKEVIPYVESKYPTAPYRVLIGHSFGGLTVINVLLNHSKLFNSYVAIDPSMWWDDQKLLKQAKATLTENKFEGISLFLAVANSLHNEMTIQQLKKDTSQMASLIRPSLELADYLNANTQNRLRVEWKYYKEFDHGSVFPPSAYDGLQFIFKSR